MENDLNNTQENETTQKNAENNTQESELTPRDVFLKRIRESRPDGKYDEDEQEVFRQAGSFIDELEARGKKGERLEEKLKRRFEEDPDEAQALLDYLDGMPLAAAIRKYKGDDAFTLSEGDEGYEEYKKAGEERASEYKKQRDLIEEIKKNGADSTAAFEEWAAENELDEEQKQAVWDLIQTDLVNLTKGKIGKDILGRYKNALNHDNDVDAAHKQGVIDGKNANIESKHIKMRGSGLPNNQAGNGDDAKNKELSQREILAQRIAGFRKG